MLFIPLSGEGGMGQGLSIPPEDRQLRAASEPTSPHPKSQHRIPVDAAEGMHGCREGRRWREGSLGSGGSSCM